MINPIDNFRWLDVRQLDPNDYNPNVVLSQEMKLLKHSILKNGWIQPILAAKEDGKFKIIDGYHRFWLSLNDKDFIAKFKFLAPVVVMEMSVPERMLLTIRINRAKGNHVAIKMHEIITEVFQTYGYSKQRIAKEIGADSKEVELLLQENVFQKLEVQKHRYSGAWVPRK